MKHDGAINIVEYPIRNMCWVHDVTGRVLRNETSVVLDQYFPTNIIDEWFDCKISGYTVEFEKDGTPFKLAINDGIRGMNIPGVIVFTNQGSAYVFY